jgi:hypothetical protein
MGCKFLNAEAQFKFIQKFLLKGIYKFFNAEIQRHLFYIKVTRTCVFSILIAYLQNKQLIKLAKFKRGSNFYFVSPAAFFLQTK